MGKTAVFRPVSWQPRLGSSLQWWPTLAGAGLAAFIALGASSGRELAPILAASGFVYLGAAALQKPSAAWPLFFGTFAVIAVNRVGLAAIDATWVFLLLSVLFVAYGLSRGAVLPTAGLPLQTIAMAGFGGGCRGGAEYGGQRGGVPGRRRTPRARRVGRLPLLDEPGRRPIDGGVLRGARHPARHGDRGGHGARLTDGSAVYGRTAAASAITAQFVPAFDTH